MAERRNRVVVLALSAIQGDARVQRQIACLAEDHDVTVVGYGHLGPSVPANVRMCALPPAWPAALRYPLVLSTTALGRLAPRVGYRAWDSVLRDHRAALGAVIGAQPDVIVANDWATLPIAVRARRATGARIVADLHEYAPLHWENRKAWMALIAPMIDYHLRRAVPELSGAVTVCRTIADRYRKEYGLECAVVRNIPAMTHAVSFRPTDAARIRLVHHGNATRERSVHRMIEAMTHTDERFSLHLRLIDIDKRYLRELRTLAARVAQGRVHFEEPMPPAEIVTTIAQYDIGIFILPPITFNYHAALPNKFFEFMRAGLAVCIGPSPEMARIVEEHACGIVVPSFEPTEVARRLNRLGTTDIDAMKQHSLAACARLTPERELEALRGEVARALAAR